MTPIVDVATHAPLDRSADALVVGVFKGGIEGPGAAPLLTALGLERLPLTPAFRGDIGQHLVLGSPALPVASVVFVGLGRMDETDDERLRRAAGVAADACGGARHVVTTLAQVHASPGAVRAVAEGFILGAHRDLRYRKRADGRGPGGDRRLERVTVLVPSSQLQSALASVRAADLAAGATITARELVNTPADRKRPEDLAAALVDLASTSCEAEVHDREALDRFGCGGILGVGRASSSPPCLVELRYEPNEPLGHIALCAPGITFDAGGLAWESSKQRVERKAAMAGVAVVAAACAVLKQLDIRLRVTALLGLAENLPGADAQRPDDIVVTHGGTTVEVTETDAAAELVLADLIGLAHPHRSPPTGSLALALTRSPDAVVDVATVSRSAVPALGYYAAAVMGNDQDLITGLLDAGAIAGERLWQLPLWEELDKRLESPIADLVNHTTVAGAPAIMSGLFLRRFARDTPWAHLDISGPAFVTRERAMDYRHAGGTGFGVRTLLAWLEHTHG